MSGAGAKRQRLGRAPRRVRRQCRAGEGKTLRIPLTRDASAGWCSRGQGGVEATVPDCTAPGLCKAWELSYAQPRWAYALGYEQARARCKLSCLQGQAQWVASDWWWRGVGGLLLPDARRTQWAAAPHYACRPARARTYERIREKIRQHLCMPQVSCRRRQRCQRTERPRDAL